MKKASSKNEAEDQGGFNKVPYVDLRKVHQMEVPYLFPRIEWRSFGLIKIRDWYDMEEDIDE